jgi:hypothetical protein
MCRVGRLLPICTTKERRELPSIGGDVVTQDVKISPRVFDFEVPVIGRQPAIDNLGDLDEPLPETEPSRRLLATIAGVALDIHCEQGLLS